MPACPVTAKTRRRPVACDDFHTTMAPTTLVGSRRVQTRKFGLCTGMVAPWSGPGQLGAAAAEAAIGCFYVVTVRASGASGGTCPRGFL